jgi:hypothetical protein
MVRSITRQGIFTTYDPGTRRMRQKNYDNRVRFSLETYSYEDAWKELLPNFGDGRDQAATA